MSSTSMLWPLEPHTRGKHLVLEAYLAAWFPILSSRARRVLFIDGFAGPGEYEGGEEGSPVLAMRAAIGTATRMSEIAFEFIFIEQDAARVEHLEGVVARFRLALPKNCGVSVIRGAFDETLGEALDALERDRKALAPAFVMIDPFGVSDTPMSLIRRILRNDKAEVYVSFMYEWINRFKRTPEFEAGLDKLFGTGEWRGVLEIRGDDDAAGKARKKFIYELYEGQLRAAGARQVVHFDLYEGGRLVYGIFFATKHSQGANKMKQAIWKVVPAGSFAFRGTRSRGGKQLTFGLEPDYGPLRAALKERFGGKGFSPHRAGARVRAVRSDGLPRGAGEEAGAGSDGGGRGDRGRAREPEAEADVSGGDPAAVPVGRGPEERDGVSSRCAVRPTA